METSATPASPSRTSSIIGWAVGILPALVLLTSATFKFIQPEGTEESLKPIGWRIDQLTWLGALEALVAIVYLIPRTSILGAVLITGYMGGAIATHLRVNDYFIFPHIILGGLVWLGVWLRDPRLRSLLPLRK